MSKRKPDPNVNRHGFKVEGRRTHSIEALYWAGLREDGSPRWKTCTTITRKIKF